MPLGVTSRTMLPTLIGTRGTSCFASKDVYGDYGLVGKEMVSRRFVILGNLIHVVLVRKRVPIYKTCYLGCRLIGIVRANSNTSVSTIIESTFGFTGYIVKYSKAWHAKKHAIELLLGDWKEAYN